MRLSGKHCLCAWLLAAPLLGQAQTAYVIDQLHIGVHTEQSLHSPLVNVLSSGTAVEILDGDETFARIKTDDGTTGWVDARYLSTEKPSRVLLEEFRSTAADLRAELATATQTGRDATELLRVAEERAESTQANVETARRAQRQLEDALAEERAKSAAANVEAARQTKRQIEDALAGARAEFEAANVETARQTKRQLKDATAEARRSVEAPISSDMLRDMQRLAEENQALKRQLTAIDSMPVTKQPAQTEPNSTAEAIAVITKPAPLRGSPATENPYATIMHWYPWQWMLLASALLLAFGVGGYLVDYAVRRRHGGFRI